MGLPDFQTQCLLYLYFSRFPTKPDEWLCLFSGIICLSETSYSSSKETLHGNFYPFTQTLFVCKPSSSKMFCLYSESIKWITILIKVSVWYLCCSSSYSWLVNKELKIGHRLSSPVNFGDSPVYRMSYKHSQWYCVLINIHISIQVFL